MPKGYPRYVLGVMIAISFLNYADRYLPTGAGPVIQQEFHLTDGQVGALGSAFLLVYALFALPFGLLADRWIRKYVVALGVGIWSLATMLTGFVGSYGALFATRAAVGVGEAGYFPAGTSLLGDFFPKASRGRAMSLWSVGQYVGIAVGFAGGGYLADTVGWRVAFFLTALPGLLLVLAAARLREPARGDAEERGPRLATADDAGLRTMFGLLRIRTVAVITVAQVLLFFVLAANAAWLTFIIVRSFHFSAGRAGLIAGLVLILGGLVGTVGGGWLADWRFRRSPAGHLEVSAVGFVAAAAAVSAALVANTLPLFLPAFFLGVAFISFYNGPFTAVTQNVVIPSLRASAVTLTLFLAHLLGDSYAPLATGLLSDAFHQDLRLALLVVSPPLLLLAAAVTWVGVRWIGADNQRMEADWASRRAAA